MTHIRRPDFKQQVMVGTFAFPRLGPVWLCLTVDARKLEKYVEKALENRSRKIRSWSGACELAVYPVDMEVHEK